MKFNTTRGTIAMCTIAISLASWIAVGVVVGWQHTLVVFGIQTLAEILQYALNEG